jgi:hypothetical protein
VIRFRFFYRFCPLPFALLHGSKLVNGERVILSPDGACHDRRNLLCAFCCLFRSGVNHRLDSAILGGEPACDSTRREVPGSRECRGVASWRRLSGLPFVPWTWRCSTVTFGVVPSLLGARNSHFDTLFGPCGVISITFNTTCCRPWWAILFSMFSGAVSASLPLFAAPCFVTRCLAVVASTFLLLVCFDTANVSRPKEHAVLNCPFRCFCAVEPYPK